MYRPIRNSGQLCPRAVRFSRCDPAPDLGELVQEFWQYDVREGFDRVPIQVFPSACVVLRFDIAPAGVESVLYAPSASPEMKSFFRHGVSAFGVALQVGRAYPVLGCGIPELGATRLPLENLWSRSVESLEMQLTAARGFEARVAVLSRALRAALRLPAGTTPAVNRWLDEVLRDSGARNGAACDRTLRRQFHRYVGHSPKQLQRIIRLQSALRRLAEPSASLPQLAIGAGFSDQSHFHREFVRLFGMTPGFFRRSVGQFHRTDLSIWQGAPILQETGLVSRSDAEFRSGE